MAGTNVSAIWGVSHEPFWTEVRVDSASRTRLSVSDVVIGKNVSMFLLMRGARGSIAVSGQAEQKLKVYQKTDDRLAAQNAHFLTARMADTFTGTVIS